MKQVWRLRRGAAGQSAPLFARAVLVLAITLWGPFAYGQTITVISGEEQTISVGGNYTDVTILPGGALDNNGIVTITGTLDDEGTLNNNSSLMVTGTLNDEDTLNNNSTLDSYSLVNTAILTNGRSGDLDNMGPLDNYDTLDNDGNLDNTGTLQNETGATLTNSDIFVNYGTLQNETGATLTNSGTLLNDGNLDNTGTLQNETGATLTNSGTLLNETGATFTNSGFLYNETGGTLSGNIDNEGSLIFASADNSTYAGVVSGTGSLTQAGSGTLTLTGANTYTGTTTISGTLVGGATDAFSAASTTGVETGGTLDLGGLAQSIDTVELAGGTIQNGTLTSANGISSTGGTIDDVSGAAALTTTAGTTTLLGSNSFTGGSTIERGMLEVGDAADPGAVLDSDVTVDTNGTLRGHGTIDGDVTNDGVVAPGGSIGALTVDGTYTQKTGGTLNIELTSSAVAGTGYDQLIVNGGASLAGTLAVAVDGGTYSAGTDYDILTATAGVAGKFSTVSYSPAFAAYLTPEVTYNADSVDLELTPTPSTSSSNDMADDLAFASGRIYVASNFAQDSALFDVVSSPLGGTTAGAADGTDRGYWLHGLGSFGHANGYDINEKGFVIGKGFNLSPDLILGGAISNTYTATSGDSSSVTGNSFGGLLYGIYNADRVTVSASAGGGHLGADISRGLPTLGETAQAASNGAYEAAALQLQYSLLRSPRFFVTPYASASYLHTGLGSAVETGAGSLDLRYDAMSVSLAELGGGVTAGLNVPVRYGTLTPWVQFGGMGALGNPHVRDTEVLGTFSAGETALTAPVGAFTPVAGVELTGTGPWRLAAAWGGQFGSATVVENFTLEGRYVW